jgi:methylated-DNA-[protein]-cysteine S-methyltransferase
MTRHIFRLERLTSPIGVVMILTDEAGRLRAVDFSDYEARLHRLLARHYGENGYAFVEHEAPSDARRALEAYFAGDLDALDGLAVETGGTPFQRAVWTALRDIPAGRTESYGALARRIGKAGASRAVGLANGSNPVAIVVPCHRVIGADRSLTGYGGGMERKRWLLEHEGIRLTA